jgi:hypothetical protein
MSNDMSEDIGRFCWSFELICLSRSTQREFGIDRIGLRLTDSVLPSHWTLDRPTGKFNYGYGGRAEIGEGVRRVSKGEVRKKRKKVLM